MKALRRLLILLALLAAGGAAAWSLIGVWDASATVQSTQDAYVHGEITGLSPRVAGYAIAIEADDDEAVAAKQVLVRIDPRDYGAAVDRAVAAVEQAKAQLGQARSQLDLQSSTIEVAEAALKGAEAQATNADTTLRRASELLSRGSGTQAAFDAASAAAVGARATADEARAQLHLQKTQVEVLKANIAVAAAKVQDAEAAAMTARRALEDTQVWAPIAGIVANRRTRVGEYVTAGTRMLSIVPTDGLWIEADFRESQLKTMKADQPVAISLDTFGARHVCGYVEAIGPASGSEFALVPPDNATGNFTKIVRRFPVRIRPSKSDANSALLKPGMSAGVRVAVALPKVDGCGFDSARDRQVRRLPKLPEHPGLGASSGFVGLSSGGASPKEAGP